MNVTVEKKKSVWRRLGAVFFFAGFAYGVFSLATFLGLDRYLDQIQYLALKKIEIDSERPLTPDIVRTWLPPIVGKNLLLLNVGAIVSTLQSKPWVSEVSIKKEFPNQLRISVRTKTPYAFAVLRDESWLLDVEGKKIDKASPRVMQGLNLPVVSFARGLSETSWRTTDAVKLLHELSQKLGDGRSISELAVDEAPYFRLYLRSPKVEVLLSAENWGEQIPRLNFLLQNPPGQAGPIQRINLVSSKKAVVSSYLSN